MQYSSLALNYKFFCNWKQKNQSFQNLYEIFFSTALPPKPEKKVLPEQRVVYSKPEKPVILLRPESKTLTTLANFRSRDKPLPELFPFPFAPESRQENRKRNPGKVPKHLDFT